MAGLGVVGAIAADTADGLIGRYLAEQFRQHRRIPGAVVGDFNGPDCQRAGIDTQMHLAPLASILGTILIEFSLAFTQELDAGAVD